MKSNEVNRPSKRFGWMPGFLRERLIRLRSQHRRRVLKNKLAQLPRQSGKRIVVGSGGTRFEGWEPTERDVLDLTVEGDWAFLFEPDSLDAILAEHVWEHLTPADAATAARNCFKYLKCGGYLRVAVPDGFHPDPNYIIGVRPGGTGDGAEDHKVLYNYETFRLLFTSVGFEAFLCEYHDKAGHFNFSDWAPSDGMIERSSRFDTRNVGGNPSYTSVILDAKKPLAEGR